MARPSRSRGPFGDPRLVERRGDLRGPSAILLVLLMVCGIGAMGALLVGLGRMVPSPAPTPAPSAAPTASPQSSHPSGPESLQPSATTRPTASVGAVVDPGAILAVVGDTAPITEADQQVGTVSLLSVVYRTRIQGQDPPSGSRWLRISARFQASATLIVDPSRWSAVDARQRRYGWTGAAAPEPALPGISLAPGQSRTGYLVIAVPASVATRSVVLQDAVGHDIVAFAIP